MSKIRPINIVYHSYLLLICLLSYTLLSCDNLHSYGTDNNKTSEPVKVDGPATDSGGGTYISTDELYNISSSLEYVLKDHFIPDKLTLFHTHLKNKLEVSYRATNISDVDYNKFSLLLQSLETPPDKETVNSCIKSKTNQLKKILIQNVPSSSSQKSYKLPRHFILEALDEYHLRHDYSFELVDLEKTIKIQCSQSVPFAIYNYENLLSSSFSELNNALHSIFINKQKCKDLSINRVHRDMVVSSFKHDAFVCISSDTTEDFKNLKLHEQERALTSLLYHEYSHMKGSRDEVFAKKFQEFVFNHLASFDDLRFLYSDLKLLKEYYITIKDFYNKNDFISAKNLTNEEMTSAYQYFLFIVPEEVGILNNFRNEADYFSENFKSVLVSTFTDFVPQLTKSMKLINRRVTFLNEVINTPESVLKLNTSDENHEEMLTTLKNLDEQFDLILRGYYE